MGEHVQASHGRTGCAGMRQFTGPAERSEAVRGGLRPPCSGSTGPDDAMRTLGPTRPCDGRASGIMDRRR